MRARAPPPLARYASRVHGSWSTRGAVVLQDITTPDLQSKNKWPSLLRALCPSVAQLSVRLVPPVSQQLWRRSPTSFLLVHNCSAAREEHSVHGREFAVRAVDCTRSALARSVQGRLFNSSAVADSRRAVAGELRQPQPPAHQVEIANGGFVVGPSVPSTVALFQSVYSCHCANGLSDGAV